MIADTGDAPPREAREAKHPQLSAYAPGPAGHRSGILLGCLAVVLLIARNSWETEIGEPWEYLWARESVRLTPWLAGAFLIVAGAIRRWSAAAFAALAVWALVLGAQALAGIASFGEAALPYAWLTGAAALALLCGGVLGCAARAPAGPYPVVDTAVLRLARLAAVLCATGGLAALIGVVESAARRPGVRLLEVSTLCAAAAAPMLVAMRRRRSPAWCGGALAGAGLALVVHQFHTPERLAYGGETSALGWLELPALAGGVLAGAAGIAMLRLPHAEPLAPAPRVAEAGDGTLALCAAMHLDRRLAGRVLSEVLDQVDRGVAPSFGVDAGLVVRHCLWAARRQRLRDAALAGTLGLVLAVWSAAVDGRDPVWPEVTAMLVLPAVIVAVERMIAVVVVSSDLRRGSPVIRPALGDADEAVARRVEAYSTGNITPYDGYYPFAGSGDDSGGWSFAIKVPEGAADSLRPQDLYREVCRDLDALGIDGLRLDDRLYADVEELRPGSPLLTGGVAPVPRTRAGHSELHTHMQSPALHHRVYRCVRVEGWAGEYVLSVFLNITQRGSSLFVGARHFLLRPVDPRFAALVRRDERLRAGMLLADVGRSLARNVVPLYAGAVPAGVRALTRSMRAAHPPGSPRPLPRRAERPSGTVAGLRELAQGPVFRRYFQQFDWEMTTKLLDRELLSGLARALRERDVDTSELETRQTAILNYGVIVNGGRFRAEGMSVGKGAKTVMNRMMSTVTGDTTRGSNDEQR